MTYEYKSHIYLAEAVLNVKNLASQTAFYQQIIGLEILSQTETEVVLGLGGTALVHLIQAQESGEVRKHYGLYHLAILLPTRKALADILKHLTDLQIPLVGGADHGYSEALYLEDLEGNGIELYRDKPVSTWDIREDGRIIGVTEAPRKQDLPGLAYYVIEVAHKEELLTIAQRAQEVDAPIKWLTSSQLEITDPDGIVTRIRLDRI